MTEKSHFISIWILGWSMILASFVGLAYSQSTMAKTENTASDIVSALLQLQVPDQDISQINSDPDRTPTADTPDDAFLFYWVRRANSDKKNSQKASIEEERRILQTLAKIPSYLPSLLVLFPIDANHIGIVKSLYDQFKDDPSIDEKWRAEVRLWLSRHSSFFRDELIRSAESTDEGEDDLIALAWLDWKQAEPIVRRLARSGNRPKAVVADGILFAKSLEMNKKDEIINLKTKLIRMALDTKTPAESRVKAFTALLNNQWTGCDTWFLSLLRDPSLLRISDGDNSGVYSPISAAIWGKETHWIPLLATQVGHANRSIHDMAATILVELPPSVEAFRPLLPCLTDPAWCEKETRKKFIQELDEVELPECFPGLLWILENDPDEDCRYSAANAIARYRDPRAVPALKKLLPQAAKSILNGESVIAAINACQGFSAEDFVTFLEALAGWHVQVETRKDDEPYIENPEDYFHNIGEYLIRRDVELSEEVFARIITRLSQLSALGEKLIAEKLEEILYHWQGNKIDQYVAGQVLAGSANITTLSNALLEREGIATKYEQGLKKLILKGGVFAGIAAAILMDSTGMVDVLHGTDVEAKIAMLGCLRYLRAPIPLSDISKVMEQSDTALVNAAESYLQAIDTLEARNVLLSRANGSIRIVGRFPGYDAGHHSINSFEELEKGLINEMKESTDLDEVIALLSAGYWGDAGQRIIRIRGPQSVFSIHENPAYVLERRLDDRELQELRDFLRSNQVDGLKPLLSSGVHDGMQYEYVHLTRGGGIRVFMNNPGLGRSSAGSIYEHLTEFFYVLGETGPIQANYKLKKQRPDLEVLFARRGETDVQSVCKVGEYLRILTGSRDFKTWSWSNLSTDGQLTPAEQPINCQILGWEEKDMSRSYGEREMKRFPWQVRFQKGIILSGRYKSSFRGLWYCRPKQKPKKFISGDFYNQLVSSDQKWLVASSDTNPVWINLITKKIYPIQSKALENAEPVAFIPSLKKFLLVKAKMNEESGTQDFDYYVLEPATGKVDRAVGDFSPWIELSYRFFQPAGKPDQVWVAKPNLQENLTEVGTYDTRRFVYTPVTKIPQIQFNSMQMWVDQAKNKFYVVYSGHLLRFSLSSKPLL